MTTPWKLPQVHFVAVFLGWLTLLPITHIQAEERVAESEPHAITVIWENDGGWIRPGGPDKHYTNGVLFSFAHQPAWADRIVEGLGLERTAAAAGYHFGQLMFTPDDLTLAVPDPADRPYAGYLFGGAFLQRENSDTLDHLQLDLGIVGPSSGADRLQDTIHSIFAGDDPKGWDFQIEDTFAYQFTYRRKWRIDLDGDGRRAGGKGFDWELIPQAGVGLGNVYRQAEFGATVRVGENLPDDFGPARIADLGSATHLRREQQAAQRGELPRWSWSVFGRAGVRLVEHNIFLDGPDGVSGRHVDSEEVVGEFTAGLDLRYRFDNHWRLHLAYSNTFLTDEFETQDDDAAFATFLLALRATW